MDITAIVVFSLLGFLFVYFNVRNYWVAEYRIHIINKFSTDEYNKLPTYKDMLFKYFWSLKLNLKTWGFSPKHLTML